MDHIFVVSLAVSTARNSIVCPAFNTPKSHCTDIHCTYFHTSVVDIGKNLTEHFQK